MITLRGGDGSDNVGSSLPITVVADAPAAVRRTAAAIIQIINTNDADAKPTKIGFATGSTMIPLYAELVSEYKRGHVSFKNVIGANLDEYAVARDHPESYYTYMHTHLYDHVDINPANVHLPDGSGGINNNSSAASSGSSITRSLDAACAAYEARLKEIGSFDIQLVGIGVDGHIGFNEPPASKDSRVHVEKLDPSTVLVNRPPSQYAITMGIANIMSAKSIIFIATGESKASVMKQLTQSPPDQPNMPASFLKSHPNVMAVCDWDAASKIPAAREEVNKMVRRGIFNSFNDEFVWGKRVLIMSPHPDDDVIGVGGLMARYSKDCEISVMYQTTGRNAVAEASLHHHMTFIESIFKKPTISTKLVAMGIRRAEAKIAAGICGVTDVDFMEMPFYRRKRREKKPPHVEDNDIVAMTRVITEKRPDMIIINGDVDPNHTHVHCKTAILHALMRLQRPVGVANDAADNDSDNSSSDDSVGDADGTDTADASQLEVNEPYGEINATAVAPNAINAETYTEDGGDDAVRGMVHNHTEPIPLYEYCSAWGEFSLSDVSAVIPLTEEHLRIKEEAVRAHESQNPPVAHNGNSTPFHERAVNNPRDALALLKKMGFDYPSHIAGVELLMLNDLSDI